MLTFWEASGKASRAIDSLRNLHLKRLKTHIHQGLHNRVCLSVYKLNDHLKSFSTIL